MFVRLFVDENLDRMIPISKQPKEKIQAIIDSCTRQFPEFAERARKRIRTYLKSCRRNKKTREGWETTSRPTPAHLTSVQAEQILAMACENESMNAKRMRIGLDPISQSAPSTAVNSVSSMFINYKIEIYMYHGWLCRAYANWGLNGIIFYFYRRQIQQVLQFLIRWDLKLKLMVFRQMPDPRRQRPH